VFQTHALLNTLLDWLYAEHLLTISNDPGIIQSTLDVCTFGSEENEFLVINLVWKNLLRFATGMSAHKLATGECLQTILRYLYDDGLGHLRRSYLVDTEANAKRFIVLCKESLSVSNLNLRSAN
jgi:hypothetical protein